MSRRKPKLGRPPHEVDWDKVDAVLKYKPTLEDAAEISGCNKETLLKAIEKEKGMSFLEYRETKLGQVRVALVRKALDLAMNGGNTALMIFCLKNLCKWRDQPEEETTNDRPVVITYVTEVADVKEN